MLDLISNHWLPLTVVIFIVVLIVYFYRSYFLPARKLKVDLQHAIDGVQSAKANSNNGIIHTDKVQHSFLHNKDLLHLWNEYTETVHEQYAFVNNQKQLVALRATVPAETFFNTAVIVDTRLNTEFFKHLPGILTGIGIIATFTGLFIGLNHFTPDTSNIELLSSGLKALMSGVQEAFAASGVAIFFAMVITFLEKNQLNERYKQVEELAQEVDALYNAGAGEEYLRELVDSSLQNQAHTAQLKDAMVNDLKTMLENLGTTIAAGFNKTMQEQMEQLLRGQAETNKQLVVAIQEGMKEPLDNIKEAVEKLAENQEKGVGEVIGVAVDKIETMFGSKLTEFGGLLNEATQTLSNTMTQITSAGNDMRQAGDKILNAGDVMEQSASSASEKLARAGEQTASSIQTAGLSFAESSRSLGDTAQKMIDATDSIGLIVSSASDAAKQLNSVKAVFADLENFLEIIKDKTKTGTDNVSQTATEIAALKEPLENAIKTLAAVSASLADGIVAPIQTALDEMKRVVVSGADNMNVAGQNLRSASIDASTQITNAGTSLSKNLESSATGIQQAAQEFNQSATDWRTISSDIKTASELLEGATGGLQTATATVQSYLSAYEQQNKNVSSLIAQVTDLVNQAQTRGELGQKQVQQMTELVAQMQRAQQEAAKFGEQVGTALAQGYEDFADATTESIQKITNDHQLTMNVAVDLIRKSISELDSKIEDVDNTISKVLQVSSSRA